MVMTAMTTERDTPLAPNVASLNVDAIRVSPFFTSPVLVRLQPVAGADAARPARWKLAPRAGRALRHRDRGGRSGLAPHQAVFAERA